MNTKGFTWTALVLIIAFAMILSACGGEKPAPATQPVLPTVITATVTLPAPATDSPTVMASAIPKTKVAATLPANTVVATVTALGDFVLEPNTLGDNPQPGENVDQQIYKKPYEAGTITNDQGKGLWTQSGKDGSAKLLGSIPSGSWLQVDSYIFWKGNQKLTGGNLIVVAGPIDLDAINISYKDGGANLVTGDLQAFLDDNVWGKFCRGNIAPDGKSFTYNPWALKNIQLPAGFTFKSLDQCAKNAAEDTTTIPDLP